MNSEKIGKWCAGLALASAALWFAGEGAAEPMLRVQGFFNNSSCLNPITPPGQEYYVEAWGYSNSTKICEISQRATTTGLIGGGLCKGQFLPSLTPNLQKAVITTRAVGTRQFIALKASDVPRPFMGPSWTFFDGNGACQNGVQSSSWGSDVPTTQ